LWSVTGSLPIPLRRNMVVYRLADGSLLLHSVIAMNDAGMEQLDRLGKPSIMIVPHGTHRMDAPFYKARYPQVRVVCPAAVRTKVQEVIHVDATAEEALPALGVRLHHLPGYKHGELAYDVDIPGGRALMLGDAVANRDYAPGLLGSFLANTSGGIKGRLGVARIVRLMLVKNKTGARADLTRLSEIPDLKVLALAHGRHLVDDCAQALREAAAAF
ncbi:MAG: hypothetical protein H7X95_04185, partial [Deltaproteobacteria bacterium]|nr:hypothetical protein [Deltaproteobacteria bacterium]